jgi:hypothetical protein
VATDWEIIGWKDTLPPRHSATASLADSRLGGGGIRTFGCAPSAPGITAILGAERGHAEGLSRPEVRSDDGTEFWRALRKVRASSGGGDYRASLTQLRWLPAFTPQASQGSFATSQELQLAADHHRGTAGPTGCSRGSPVRLRDTSPPVSRLLAGLSPSPSWPRNPNRFPGPLVKLAALLSLLNAQSRGALSQIGKEKVHDCFLVNGDIRCCHGSAQPLIPRRGLSAPAQAEPVPGRNTINCNIVITAESPGAGAALEDAALSQCRASRVAVVAHDRALERTIPAAADYRTCTDAPLPQPALQHLRVSHTWMISPGCCWRAGVRGRSGELSGRGLRVRASWQKRSRPEGRNARRCEISGADADARHRSLRSSADAAVRCRVPRRGRAGPRRWDASSRPWASPVTSLRVQADGRVSAARTRARTQP